MRRALLIPLSLACVLLATLPLLAEEPEAPAPAPAADDATIQRLVADLGSSDFAKREKASRELLALGDKARPALEHTMKHGDNMEARWRAEQILRRLDREGERPMGQQPDAAPTPRPAPVPEAAPPAPDDLDKVFEAMRRRFLDGFGPNRFGGFGPGSKRLEAPGLRLDAETFANRLVQVRLLDEETSRMHVGLSLEDIVERNPELAKRAGMPALQEKWAAFKVANPSLFRPGSRGRPGGGLTFSRSSRGVEVIQSGEGVTVRIRERGDDGEEKVTEVKGATLDEIKAKHPELRDRLDQFTVTMQIGPVQIFRGGRRADPRLPVPPATPPVITPGDMPPSLFGVRLLMPEPVLAVHLGLEPGHGALVTEVLPGAQAALMGLERYDVIVAVNGKPVTDFHAAASALRKAGRDRSPLTLDVIRRGQRTTLER